MSEIKVHLDFESASTQPFGKGSDAVTTWQYARHPETFPWCMSWAIGDNPTQLWDAFEGEPFPDDVSYALADGLTFAAHNAGFEWMLWNYILVPRWGLEPLPIEQMDCTAARAAIMALPRALDGMAKALGLDVQKDDKGKRLMMQMAKPRKPRKDEDPNGIYWWDDKDRRVRLGEYCITDTDVEREADKLLKPMTRYQREQWLRVHRMNMRGVDVDVRFVEKAKRIVSFVESRYDDRLYDLTGGEVNTVTAMPAMKRWLNDQGVDASSLDKTAVIHLLDEHKHQPEVCEVLQIRQEAGKSSVAKLNRFETLSDEQCRMLENFLFHGANTGRLAGKGAQLQNLPSRGGLPWYWAEECIDIILNTPDPAWAVFKIEAIYGEIPVVLSSCLRGIIKARKGKKLFVADFSNIEGRVAAWLGNERWKLEAFRAFDAGTGPDLYKVTASQILGKLVELINKTERNVMGKVPELALGFGGGVGAFESMAKIYNVNMADYWEIIRAAIDEQFVEKARWAWSKFGEAQADSMGMTMEGWLASETVKNAWRDRHPGIKRCWDDCDALSIKALQRPGKWFEWAGGKCKIGAQEIAGKTFLVYRLPSGRRLYRADASLKPVKKFGRNSNEIRFWGVDGVTRQWKRMSTYGGDTFQSFVQAIAYDLMDNGWANIEADGFDPVLSVHDELGAEGDINRTLEDFEAGMGRLPVWAQGCPVSSAGYVSERYRKDE